MADNSKQQQQAKWIGFLEDEDIAFMKRFILSSGSLKQVAREYGVSYPTVRLRLDRLIQKITIIDEQNQGDDFEILLSTMVTSGKLDSDSYRKIRDAYTEQKHQENEAS